MKKFLLLSLVMLVAVSVFAERKALIIGNASYEGISLASPINDLTAMENALGGWGYAVTKIENADLRRLDAAIGQFALGITAEDDVFFYYSGFAAGEGNQNYLLPVGINPAARQTFSHTGYSMQRLMQQLAPARNSIVMVESGRSVVGAAGRSTPLHLVWQPACSGSQSLIFSSAPYRTIPQQNLTNSAFTQAFIQKFNQSEDPYNETIPVLIREFRAQSQSLQVPWFTGYLSSELYFNLNSQRWRFRSNWMDIEGGGSLSW